MIAAELRLRMIADAADLIAESVRGFVERGQPLDAELTADLSTWLESVSVYARASGLEPQSYRVHGGLRVVK